MATSTINSSTASPSAPSIGGIDYTGPNYDPGNGFQPGDPSYRPTNPFNPSQAGGTILNTSSLAPATTKIPYVEPKEIPTGTIPSADANANAVDEYIKAQTGTTQQPTESVADKLSRDIANLIGQKGNEQVDKFNALDQLGYTQKLESLKNAQQRYNDIRASYLSGQKDLLVPGKSAYRLSLQQKQLQAEGEAKMAFAQADIAALQGDIEFAKKIAQDGVDRKNAVFNGQIEQKKAQLEALKPILDKEGVIRANAQTAALDKLKKENDAKAQEEKDWNAAKIDATAGNIPIAILDKADQAFKAGNKNQAYALLGPYGKAYLERQSLSADIAKKWADANKTKAEADAAGGVVSGGDFSDTVKTAANLVDGEGRAKTFAKDVQSMINRGQYAPAYNNIKNVALKGYTASGRADLEEKDKAIPYIQKLQKDIEDYKNAGGDMGLLSGKSDEIKRKLFGITGNPELSAIARNLNESFFAYRSNVSGAAFSGTETRDYKSVNPSTTNTFELNDVIMKSMLDSFKTQVNAAVDTKVDGAKYIREYAQNPSLAKKASTPEAQFVNSAVLPALQTTSNVPAGFIVDTKTFTQQFPTK